MSRKTIRRIGGWGALMAGLIVAFKMFEPVLTYNTGWENMPARHDAPSSFEASPAAAESGQAADDVLRSAYETTDHPALSAAVGTADGLLWRGVIGYEDLTKRSAAKFDSAFRIGSSSKAVTAMAIGRLMTEGELSLATPLRGLDPTLPETFADMTLGHAMSHRGGIRNYGMCFCMPVWEFLNRRHFETVRDAVTVIEDDPLLFTPGTDFQYTSLGYNLAGLAIVSATQMPFPEALATLVTDTLGMTSTFAEGAPNSPAPQVIFYDVEPRGYKPTFRVDNTIKWPSGGLLSTPSDMVKLGAAMLDTRLISRDVRTALLTVPPLGSDYYAHGWRVSPWALPNGETPLAWHHHGTAAGSRSVFFILPDYGLVVSLVSNKGGQSTDDLVTIADEIAMPFIKATQSPASEQ